MLNENLSISWGELEETYDAQDNASTSVADDAMESTSIQFAYTMGSMSIAGSYHTVDNIANTSTDDRNAYEVQIKFNF